MTSATIQQSPEISWKILFVRFMIMNLLLVVVLFGTAGQLQWWSGWVYVATLAVLTFAGRVIIMRRNPDMLTERMNATSRDDTKKWDKILMPLMATFIPIVVLAIAGLDARFGWSLPVALWLKIAAWGLMVLGILFSTWAMIVNHFFSATVRIQTDRNHHVISDGPYQFVRHPGYAGGVVANLVAPVMLGSLWALIPALLLVTLTILRTQLEDRTLQDELPGYREYVQQVHYRLVPGIW